MTGLTLVALGFATVLYFLLREKEKIINTEKSKRYTAEEEQLRLYQENTKLSLENEFLTVKTMGMEANFEYIQKAYMQAGYWKGKSMGMEESIEIVKTRAISRINTDKSLEQKRLIDARFRAETDNDILRMELQETKDKLASIQYQSSK